MKRSQALAWLAVPSCAALLCGCFVSPVTVAASTHPITAKSRVTELGPASGSAWGVFIFGYPLSDPSPAKTARDQALFSKSADALTGVTMEFRSYILGPVTVYETRIEGEAVKLQ